MFYVAVSSLEHFEKIDAFALKLGITKISTSFCHPYAKGIKKNGTARFNV